jgi:hypothetical protein
MIDLATAITVLAGFGATLPEGDPPLVDTAHFILPPGARDSIRKVRVTITPLGHAEVTFYATAQLQVLGPRETAEGTDALYRLIAARTGRKPEMKTAPVKDWECETHYVTDGGVRTSQRMLIRAPTEASAKLKHRVEVERLNGRWMAVWGETTATLVARKDAA